MNKRESVPEGEVPPNEERTVHRRRLDSNGGYAHERRTDTDKLAKANAFFDRYSKIITILFIAFFGWFMRGVVEPLKAIPVIVERQHEVDSTFKTLNKKLDNQMDIQSQMAEIITILAAIRCSEFTPREKIASRLCQKILLSSGE